jgi:branched-chain amino acid transport system substrate-binding protein
MRKPQINRRRFLATAGAGALAATPLRRVAAQTRTIRIGFVAPMTGFLAFFSEHVPFVMKQVDKATGGKISVGGQEYQLEILLRDTQSDPNRASEVASELILKDDVNLMLSGAAPETTNPVADQCEVNGVPCLTNDAPIDSYFLGRHGDAKVGFQWTYHFSFDTLSQVRTFIGSWKEMQTNKVIGGLWPNDTDGRTYPAIYAKLLKQEGFHLVDPGRFDLPSGTYNAQIAAFKSAGVEIVTGVLPPPEFTLFWNGCAQQGYRPKIVTLGKALEFPAGVGPLGDRAIGLTTDALWAPSFPFTSGLSRQTAQQLADAYEQESGHQASFMLGGRHGLFEVGIHALQQARGVDHASIRDALREIDYDSVCGHINFKHGIFPNVCSTPIVTVQWNRGTKHPYEMFVVSNTTAPNVPVQAKQFFIPYS